MISIIYYLIGLSCLTILFVNSTPMISLKVYFNLMEKGKSRVKNIFVELLNCCMCSGFWIGLIYFIFTTDIINAILYAAIVSVMSELIYKKL